MKRKFKKNVLVTGFNQSFINRNPPLPTQPRPERAIHRPRIASNQWNFRSIVRRFFQNDESEVDIEAFHDESEDDETEIMVPSYQCSTSGPTLQQECSSDNLLITDDEVSKVGNFVALLKMMKYRVTEIILIICKIKMFSHFFQMIWLPCMT